MTKTTWGRWTFNDANSCLETVIAPATGAIYQISVDEITTSAEMLDWLFQVEEKTWATSADVGDLISAFVALLGRSVASNGKDHPIDPKAILAKRFGTQIT